MFSGLGASVPKFVSHRSSNMIDTSRSSCASSYASRMTQNHRAGVTEKVNLLDSLSMTYSPAWDKTWRIFHFCTWQSEKNVNFAIQHFQKMHLSFTYCEICSMAINLDLPIPEICGEFKSALRFRLRGPER